MNTKPQADERPQGTLVLALVHAPRTRARKLRNLALYIAGGALVGLLVDVLAEGWP